MEKYQFSDLADALNVWLYGTYTNSSAVVYVVDGNIITDVNAYSIYDVDEVTLVQNAMAQVSGAGTNEQMVLIKLKTHRPGKQGIVAAGQTSLVNSVGRGAQSSAKSTNNFYHQYYLGGYKNLGNASFGLSADYQRDVLPFLIGYPDENIKPDHIDRIKLMGYANAQLWAGTSLNFGINYVPQSGGESQAFPFPGTGNQTNFSLLSQNAQHMAASNIAVNSVIAKGLTNTLSAAYNHFNYFLNDTQHISSQGNDAAQFAKESDKTTNLLLRDNLAYHFNAGVFDFEPALNFSYRNFKSTITENVATLNTQSNYPPQAENSMFEDGVALKTYLLTPSLNIYYKNAFDLQAGFVEILNSDKDFESTHPHHRLSPFISATIDILKLASVDNGSLKVFGSFSQQSQLLDDPYANLAGFDIFVPTNVTYINPVSFSTGPTSGFYESYTINPYEQFNSFQAGFTLAVIKNLTLDYSFKKNYGEDVLVVLVPYGYNEAEPQSEYYFDAITTNRFGISYHLKTKNTDWQTGLNIAQETLQPTNNVIKNYSASYLTGHRYSGGFTNRFTCGRWFAGMDILYQFGERPVTLAEAIPGNVVAPTNKNSVSLQSLYIGGQIKINHIKYAEIFANTRNILQNNSSDITDNRRFYGVGFKIGL